MLSIESPRMKLWSGSRRSMMEPSTTDYLNNHQHLIIYHHSSSIIIWKTSLSVRSSFSSSTTNLSPKLFPASPRFPTSTTAPATTNKKNSNVLYVAAIISLPSFSSSTSNSYIKFLYSYLGSLRSQEIRGGWGHTGHRMQINSEGKAVPEIHKQIRWQSSKET